MSERLTCRSDVFVEVTAELLGRGCAVRFSAAGGSMYPTIRDGESITVAPAGPAEIKRGDVVAYRRRHRVLAHRVVRIEHGDGDARALVLRGDAARSCDAPVAPTEMLGKVVSVERNGRQVSVRNRRAKLARAARVGASRAKRLLLSQIFRRRTTFATLFTTKLTKLTKGFRGQVFRITYITQR